MDRKAAEVAKLRHNLHKYGRAFTFIRPGTNAYGEPDANAQETSISLNGIFHENSGGLIVVNTGESGRMVTKPLPMILCIWDDFETNKVILDDKVTINSIDYKVVGYLNVGQMDFAADISLEKVL